VKSSNDDDESAALWVPCDAAVGATIEGVRAATGGGRRGVDARLVVGDGLGMIGGARVGTDGARAGVGRSAGPRLGAVNGEGSFGGGGSIGGSGPAMTGSLRIIASRLSNCKPVPDEWSSPAPGTMSPSVSRSSVESASDVRPFGGCREKRFRNLDTADGATVCGGASSSGVKKSGPAAYDEVDGDTMTGARAGVAVSLNEPKSTLGLEAMLVRGVAAGVVWTCGEVTLSGVVDAGVTVSDGAEEVRLSQPERKPPPFVFRAAAAAFMASVVSSGFFSKIRHPVGA
jgi:hypothetical protein